MQAVEVGARKQARVLPDLRPGTNPISLTFYRKLFSLSDGL